MMKRNKLAIFDMDGTLFNTDEVNFRAYKTAAEKYGYEIDRDMFLQVFQGKNYREFLPMFGITTDRLLSEIHEEKKKIYPKCLSFAQINRRLFQLIESIRKDYIIVLATTASRKNTEDILRHFKVAHLFDYMVTQEDTVNLKPHPECYEKAMQLTGVDSHNTIIFEDSEVGIVAAKASGAAVYKVYL